MAKKIVWSDEARADVRAIDRATALWLLQGLARFALTESGDVKQLEGYDPFASAIAKTPIADLRQPGWRYRRTKITAFDGDDMPRIVAITGTSPFGAEIGTCALI